MSNLSDESVAEIANALIRQSQLNYLAFPNNSMGRNGCVALGNTLMSWHAPRLTYLCLQDNAIDDQGLRAMASGLTNCHNLAWLDLEGNHLTAAGLRSLSGLFQSESCSLKELSLRGMNIGDDGVIALANVLKDNKSLKRLRFNPYDTDIIGVGWEAFSDLLCDTSNVNNTYLSNHTLEMAGSHDNDGASFGVAQYLAMNQHLREDAVIYKMFESHTDFNMQPFFQWKLKFLPVVLKWFESAGECSFQSDEGYLQMLENRKLSAVYQFVRVFPVLVLSGYPA